MSLKISRPLSEDDKKILAAKSAPSEEDIRRAEDELFLNLLARVAELERKNEEAT